MDLSLANALYFASRGVGHIHCEAGEDALPYTSPARVLLSGLGSDELLGGYGRHRTTFKCGSWPALIDEVCIFVGPAYSAKAKLQLQSEIDRIPMRNLGRDDRVISTHGKECRYPFLSLDFVSFAAGLPVHMKTDPRAEPGVGDKLLLRLMMWKLGLFEASARHKKAMQFGSHSARMLGGSGDKKGHLAIE
jgi:asparagine synthetase B (glutamine-hydrolysing)